MKIIKNYLTKNRCYQQNVKRVPIGIQVHTIGTAQGTAQSVADYWNQSSVSACVTYIVDCDTEGKVLQTLPEDVRTWADAGYGNNYLITFEICESDAMRYTGGADYIVLDERKFKEDLRRGYNTAVELCADICRRYGWDPLARLSSGLCLISSHDEGRSAGLSSAHVDPTHIWPRIGKTMDDFRPWKETIRLPPARRPWPLKIYRRLPQLHGFWRSAGRLRKSTVSFLLCAQPRRFWNPGTAGQNLPDRQIMSAE